MCLYNDVAQKVGHSLPPLNYPTLQGIKSLHQRIFTGDVQALQDAIMYGRFLPSPVTAYEREVMSALEWLLNDCKQFSMTEKSSEEIINYLKYYGSEKNPGTKQKVIQASRRSRNRL